MHGTFFIEGLEPAMDSPGAPLAPIPARPQRGADEMPARSATHERLARTIAPVLGAGRA